MAPLQHPSCRHFSIPMGALTPVFKRGISCLALARTTTNLCRDALYLSLQYFFPHHPKVCVRYACCRCVVKHLVEQGTLETPAMPMACDHIYETVMTEDLSALFGTQSTPTHTHILGIGTRRFRQVRHIGHCHILHIVERPRAKTSIRDLAVWASPCDRLSVGFKYSVLANPLRPCGTQKQPRERPADHH
jgi:hypothetical protein